MGVKNKEILLEAGTNELEVLEFVIEGNRFGINVAKVVELMQVQPVQPIPHSHPCVEGVFQPRQEVFPLIDLAAYLNLPASQEPEKDIYIITTFNKIKIAFHVQAVESIHRISWTDIEKPDSIIFGGKEGIVTGIAKTQGRIISILDFEKIVFDISPETGIQFSEIDRLGDRAPSDLRILIAEDSDLLRKMLVKALTRSGYTHLIITGNGQEAWDFLQGSLSDLGGEATAGIELIVTDIEMPLMDGHRLTKLIKADARLQHIPVVIFSSLIDETMRLKGIEVGADAQLSKPEIGNLVQVVDQLIQKQG